MTAGKNSAEAGQPAKAEADIALNPSAEYRDGTRKTTREVNI